MNDISCGICRDLIPLVRDGVAGEDSRTAVEAHIAGCESCRAVYAAPAPAADSESAFPALWRRARMLLAMIMMLGIFVGISFTNSQELFYNALLMPLIGGLGFLVFRWKAVYGVPLLLLVFGLVALGLDTLRGLGQLDAPSLLLWTVIYSGFAMVGMLIAALLCFALKKEDTP